ncbi:hypothetical protein PV325_014077 [Microctonus aethiopoides]|nr:hypothetical protein PV325_014077 [Microctonus aethiopoides]
MKIIICLGFVIALTLAEPPSYRQQFQRDRQTYYVAKQQQHESETESPEDSPSDAPYQPSGWKPDGPEFELPEKQQQSAPKQQYGAPNKVENQYGAPAAPPSPVQRQYGGPVRGQKQFSVSQQQYRAQQKQYNVPQEQNSTPQQNYGVPQQQYGAPQATTDPSTVTDYEESTTQSTATESQAEPVDSVNELDEAGDANEQQRQSGEYFIALPDGRLQRVQYISSQNIEAMKYFAKIRAENVEPLRGPIYAYQPLQKLQFAPSQLQVQAIDESIAPIAPAIVTEVRENNNKNQKIIKASTASVTSASSASSSLSAKLQIQPLAAELPGAPLSTSYTTYMANYQVPAAEQRYFITF